MIRRLCPLVVATVSLGADAYVLAGVLPRIADSLATTVGAIGIGAGVLSAAARADDRPGPPPSGPGSPHSPGPGGLS